MERQVKTEPELQALLNSMASWLDGMSRFISIAKSQWPHPTSGRLLLAQKLAQHTLKLKADLSRLNLSHALKEDTPSGEILPSPLQPASESDTK